MRIPFLSKLSLTLSLVVLLSAAAAAQTAPGEASKLLPEQLGDFRPRGAAVATWRGAFERVNPEDYGVESHAHRVYTSADGKTFAVHLARTTADAAAYSLFTAVRPRGGAPVKLGEVGTASVSDAKEILFSKGRACVSVADIGQGDAGAQALSDFARAFAATLEGGEAGLPVLVSHLPEWEKSYERADYAVTLPALQSAAGRRPALDALSFEGGAEAVAANYGGALLVVVEFTTPQHAFDADAAVNQRIAELKAAGQPVPSGYKRVGNYAVFAFDAPDAEAAEKLVAGVKWEKDVRWLGHNPYAEEKATRAYTSTMGGVIKTTLIMTGLAILACLGVGGLIGGVVFLRRRARQTEQEIYTDAGGMVRLNIEDLNTPSPSSKLLKPAQD